MSATLAVEKPEIVYPVSDGEPMPDGGLQFWWINFLHWNLSALFADRPDVYVSGNQFWFPVEGEPETRVGPDVYVVFGRPKGHRESYRQWEEDGVPMTVVFEIISPANSWTEMIDKFLFYDEHRADEFYIFDPELKTLTIYVRGQATLRRVALVDNVFVSPRLGIRFDLSGPEMAVFCPDGRPFLSPEEIQAERLRLEQRAGKAEERAGKAEERAGKAEERAGRLAELGLKLLAGQATDEEKAEFTRLASTAPN